MAEKELIIKEKIEHNGIFDFKGLYSYSHDWFKEEKFAVTEDKYAEKVSGNARDIDIEWSTFKRLSDYFKIEIAVKFEIKGLTEVEVEIEGVRKKMNKGSLSVEIKGTLVKDPESKWDVTPFYRFTRDIYNKYIIPTRVDSIEFKITGDVRKFKDKLKTYMDQWGVR